MDGLTSAAKTGVPAVKASDKVVGAFFKTIEQGTDILKGGTKNVNKFIDNVFEALRKWVGEKFVTINQDFNDTGKRKNIDADFLLSIK